MRLRAGTGLSRARDSYAAGREAALASLAPLGSAPSSGPPALVVTFTMPGHDLPALLAGIRSVTGTAMLVGATASGEIVRDEYLGFGGGVGVLSMTAGPYRFGVASAHHIRDDLDQAGQLITRTSRGEAGPSPYAAVFLLADSLLGDLQQIVQGVYRVTGAQVPIIGGCAGDEQKFRRTFVFHNDTIVEEGAVAVWIASERPLRVVTRHGWQPIGPPMLITRAKSTEIIEIGGRPAATVYEEQLGFAPGQLTQENFWNTALRHPFGLLQPDGSVVIRVPRARTEEGWLRIQGCPPPAGGAIQIMTGSPDMLLDIADGVARDALNEQPDASVLFAFSCAARATIFGPRTPEEPRRLQSAAGDIPVFGFYCCAEFARTSGVLGTHNATLTALAL